MSEKSILYFEAAGEANTTGVARVVKERCRELKIHHVVCATNTGRTAFTLWEQLKPLGVRLVAVAHHAGFLGGDRIELPPEQRERLEREGIPVLITSHALSGVERAISHAFGGVSRVEIIAHTLRRFGGDGLKVAVEVAVMAADAGLVPTTEEIIAVGGTQCGADTAIVLRAAHMNNFFDIEIREILAKPRQRAAAA